MRTLVLKIFLCYWVVAGIVIFGIDVTPHDEMHRPEIAGALRSSLRLQSRAVLLAYESGGCAAAAPLFSDSVNTVTLASPDGSILCSPAPADHLGSLIAMAAHSKSPMATDFRTYQVLAFAVSSPTGKPYIVLMKSPFTAPMLSGMLPGRTTVIISALVTLVMAILIAIPIRYFRRAAGEIANGHLETRVNWGRGSRVLALFSPLDVLHELSIDFNHMAERLQSLVTAQRLLFRDVSHELRSPLARLSVALELARETGPPSMKAPLDRIEVEAARVNNLVGQILSLSYMETVQEPARAENLSLGELVGSVIPDTQYEADRRGCSIALRTVDECTIRGDTALLQCALENVLRNAIRYSPENGTVEIDLARVDRHGAPFAVLRVGDNGPGVPAEELESILRPFYRVDKSRQMSTGGFGIGLAIAERVLTLHGGDIRASNRPGGGLLIEMSVPLFQ